MPIKLMYITNDPVVAKIAERAGVDRIFVDMEYIGKDKRQGGMDTVQSHHTLKDVREIKSSLSSAELLVRCNPIHKASADYTSSREEIDEIIKAGADIIMLPYFKTVSEVSDFIRFVGGRARTLLLFETPEAREQSGEILQLDGIDEAFIGLNDMSLGYGMKFMFELLANGTVDELCQRFKKRGIPYGFGGLASLDGGLLPGRMVLKEHYRLGSDCVILSRSFLNTSKISDYSQIEEIFNTGVKKIREHEAHCTEGQEENRKAVISAVKKIIEE